MITLAHLTLQDLKDMKLPAVGAPPPPPVERELAALCGRLSLRGFGDTGRWRLC